MKIGFIVTINHSGNILIGIIQKQYENKNIFNEYNMTIKI